MTICPHGYTDCRACADSMRERDELLTALATLRHAQTPLEIANARGKADVLLAKFAPKAPA